MSAAHPAAALVLAAEALPCFHYETRRVEEILAAASQTEPDTLSARWVVRLAHRFVDVLLQTDQLDRVTTWLGIAGDKLADADAVAAVDQPVLEARLAVRRGDDPEPALARARHAVGDAPLDDPARATRETRFALALAEHHVAQRRFGPLDALLTPRVKARGAFATLDDLWRAHRLLGLAHQMRLEFERGAAAHRAVVKLCAEHDADLDRADALIRLGQCTLGAGDYPGALACFRDAHALAPPRSALFRDASAALTTGILSSGDLDAAIDVARHAARQSALADDYTGYVQLVGVVTHLMRIGGRHEQAYRNLLGIYGLMLNNLGEAATEPIVGLINQLRADLGDAEFEALSAKILAEKKARG